MKLGASYWMFDGGLEAKLDIEDAMNQAKSLGYDSIELCIASSGVLTENTTQEQCKAIVETAKKIGIEISSVASGESWTSSPTSNNEQTREKMVDFTNKALQITSWLGADAYLLVPGAVDVFFLPDAEIISYDICMERAKEFVKKLTATAEKFKVHICIENVWNKFLLSPLEMRDFIDSFKSDFVGSYFDVGNVLLTGFPEQWINILGSRIKRVHIKDFKKSFGTAEGFVDLLEGDVDFEAVKKALKEIGYDGYATAEMLPYQPGRPEKTIAAMKKIFG